MSAFLFTMPNLCFFPLFSFQKTYLTLLNPVCSNRLKCLSKNANEHLVEWKMTMCAKNTYQVFLQEILITDKIPQNYVYCI